MEMIEAEKKVLKKKPRKEEKNEPPRVKNLDGVIKENQRPVNNCVNYNLPSANNKSWELRFTTAIEKALGGDNSEKIDCSVAEDKILRYVISSNITTENLIDCLSITSQLKSQTVNAIAAYGIRDLISLYCTRGKINCVTLFLNDFFFFNMQEKTLA